MNFFFRKFCAKIVGSKKMIRDSSSWKIAKIPRSTYNQSNKLKILEQQKRAITSISRALYLSLFHLNCAVLYDAISQIVHSETKKLTHSAQPEEISIFEYSRHKLSLYQNLWHSLRRNQFHLMRKIFQSNSATLRKFHFFRILQ